MAKKRTPKIIHYLVYEDIREESNNRVSLMGIATLGVIRVPVLPFILPKIGFHLVFDNIKATDTFQMHMLDPDGKTLTPPNASNVRAPKQNKSKKEVPLIMQVVFNGLNIEKEGSHKLVLMFNEDPETQQVIDFDIIHINQQGE